MITRSLNATAPLGVFRRVARGLDGTQRSNTDDQKPAARPAGPRVPRGQPGAAELGTGRLVAAHFADPARLVRLGEDRFRAFAAHRGVRVPGVMAARLVQAARAAIPMPEAAIARQVLAAGLALLGDLDTQIGDAEDRLAVLLPATEYAVLATVPGWGVVTAYAAACGPSGRWASAARIYRAAGSPR